MLAALAAAARTTRAALAWRILFVLIGGPITAGIVYHWLSTLVTQEKISDVKDNLSRIDNRLICLAGNPASSHLVYGDPRSWSLMRGRIHRLSRSVNPNTAPKKANAVNPDDLKTLTKRGLAMSRGWIQAAMRGGTIPYVTKNDMLGTKQSGSIWWGKCLMQRSRVATYTDELDHRFMLKPAYDEFLVQLPISADAFETFVLYSLNQAHAARTGVKADPQRPHYTLHSGRRTFMMVVAAYLARRGYTISKKLDVQIQVRINMMAGWAVSSVEWYDYTLNWQVVRFWDLFALVPAIVLRFIESGEYPPPAW